MNDSRNVNTDLKTALATWVEKHTNIPDFSRAMNYSYQHGWSLVSSKAPVTDSVIGRFVLTYGVEALGEWFALTESEHA
jgi:hypothetical protein